MQKKTWFMLGVAAVLVVAATVCVDVLHPWSKYGSTISVPESSVEDFTLQDDDNQSGDSVETDSDGLTDDGNIAIAGREVDYSPGEYGAVVVSEVSAEDFSSTEAYEDYEANWHDKSWQGEQPATGRYKYAHYEEEDGFSWVAGEVVVVFPYETDDAQIEEAVAQRGAKIGSLQYSEKLQDYKTALFYYADDALDPLAEAAAVQAAMPDVIAAFPNTVGSADSVSVNDSKVSLQKYLSMSGFYNAWSKVKCGGSVAVAVLDSGIDFDHPDLVNNIDTSLAYDAINNTELSGETEDVRGHGTKVAGIVAAEANNAKGIAGCSYNAVIVPVRVVDDEGLVDVFDVSSALDYLVEHAGEVSVVNMSFGFQVDDWWDFIGEIAYGLLCQDKISLLSSDYGVVFVAAAGNEGKDGNYVEYPAALDNVVSVAAVDENSTRASFSTANDTVDICAYGTNVYSTTTGSGYGNAGNGTSFAAPQVAAAAALLRVQQPSWSAERIVNRIESTAELLADMTDLDENGKDNTGQYGYGLLDAAAAVGYSASSSGGSYYTGGIYLPEAE